jgi:biotin transport system substrate-specific component
MRYNLQVAGRPANLVDAIIPGTGILRDIALIAGFTALVIIFAQIAIRLPFTPVPITGQTLAVLVTGGALGANRGAASLGLYAVLGIVGAPVFAPSGSALEGELLHFIFPWAGTGDPVWNLTSGGYIVGFILAAFVVGKLTELGWERSWRVSVTMLIGSIVLYIPGLLWLGYVISSGFLDTRIGVELSTVLPGTSTVDQTLIAGLYPFVVGDLIKLVIAMIVLPGAWELVGRKKG